MTQPRRDDMQQWMIDIAKEAAGSTDSFVFVMRKALTAAYQQGFDDGHHAADGDRYVQHYIDDVMRKSPEQAEGDR